MGLYFYLIEKFKKIYYNIYRKLRKEKNMFSPAFMGWAHEEELNKIVNAILTGENELYIRDNLSQGDLEYIKIKLREAGYEAELTLN